MIMRKFILFGILCLATGRLAGQVTRQQMESWINGIMPDLVTSYQYLHKNPELSYQEENTSRYIAGELRKLGFDVTEKIGGYGVVGLLGNGPGPTLMIRTDMDALPIIEKTGLFYASTIKGFLPDGTETGVMHACGHDMHMTVFLGVARFMATQKKLWTGTLMLVAQPAEERGAGANAMITDGLFRRFPVPVAALALHVNPDLEAGTVGVHKGPTFAGSNSINLMVYGVGGHGAYPQNTIDPIVLSARIILDLQTIISREINPLEPAVLTVGSIHGGTQYNIIPDEVQMKLTLRSYSAEVNHQMVEAIKRISQGVAISTGLPQEKYPRVTEEGSYLPPVINDDAFTEKVSVAMKNCLGADQVIDVKPLMVSEDFGRYGLTEEKIPICIYWLGVSGNLSEEKAAPLHSPQFAPVVEKSILTGIMANTSVAIAVLKK
jgi:amidohydrolase